VVGKNYMNPAAAGRFGNYPALGKNAAKKIRGAQLAELPDVGHIPHLEAPSAFHRALLKFISPPLAR
jgi:pimeloyl-ACP methyl ester carboxylesterase